MTTTPSEASPPIYTKTGDDSVTGLLIGPRPPRRLRSRATAPQVAVRTP